MRVFGAIVVIALVALTASLALAMPDVECPIRERTQQPVVNQDEVTPHDQDEGSEGGATTQALSGANQTTAEPVDLERLKAEIKQELLAELASEREGERPAQATSAAVGTILRRGEPLGGCKVRAVRLEAAGMFGGVRMVDEGHTVTGSDGSFRFDSLPPGPYKLSWAPPGGTHWIRRLQMEPDFVVELGQETVIEPLEVGVSTLN